MFLCFVHIFYWLVVLACFLYESCMHLYVNNLQHCRLFRRSIILLTHLKSSPKHSTAAYVCMRASVRACILYGFTVQLLSFGFDTHRLWAFISSSYGILFYHHHKIIRSNSILSSVSALAIVAYVHIAYEYGALCIQ